jgi:uncharacterized membrane protein YfhO
VSYGGSTRVVLEAQLQQPGIVILADVFDSGWQLTVDGRPAPILRANLLMRAAAITAGAHRLVFTYSPALVPIGALVSAAALAGLIASTVWAHLQPPPKLNDRSRT